MDFDLQSNWLDLAESKQLHEQLAVDVGNSKMAYISLGHAQLHLCPKLLNWLVVEFSLIVGINKRPVKIHQIQVFQLHELQGFLHFALHALSPEIAQLGGDEEFFTLDSALSDDCLNGVAQWDFVVIQASPVDVPACAELQSFPQQFGDQILIPQLVGPKPLQLQNLLIRQRFKRWSLLLLPLFLSHVSYIICMQYKTYQQQMQNQLNPALLGSEFSRISCFLVLCLSRLNCISHSFSSATFTFPSSWAYLAPGGHLAPLSIFISARYCWGSLSLSVFLCKHFLKFNNYPVILRVMTGSSIFSVLIFLNPILSALTPSYSPYFLKSNVAWEKRVEILGVEQEDYMWTGCNFLRKSLKNVFFSQVFIHQFII